jgi:hypothetical protein
MSFRSRASAARLRRHCISHSVVDSSWSLNHGNRGNNIPLAMSKCPAIRSASNLGPWVIGHRWSLSSLRSDPILCCSHPVVPRLLLSSSDAIFPG